MTFLSRPVDVVSLRAAVSSGNVLRNLPLRCLDEWGVKGVRVGWEIPCCPPKVSCRYLSFANSSAHLNESTPHSHRAGNRNEYSHNAVLKHGEVIRCFLFGIIGCAAGITKTTRDYYTYDKFVLILRSHARENNTQHIDDRQTSWKSEPILVANRYVWISSHHPSRIALNLVGVLRRRLQSSRVLLLLRVLPIDCPTFLRSLRQGKGSALGPVSQEIIQIKEV